MYRMAELPINPETGEPEEAEAPNEVAAHHHHTIYHQQYHLYALYVQHDLGQTCLQAIHASACT